MSRALALVESDESRKKETPGTAKHRPLLETKLYAPRAQAALVARPRLLDAIRNAANHKLTIVVAPAGFGKTTLLAGWLADPAGPGKSVAWVSLDPSDNEPQLFWAYVIRALEGIHPAAGAQAMAQLLSAGAASIEGALATLINEVNALDQQVTLVLDDYHVIDSPAIHSALTHLLDRLPPRMHIVIATRAEPPLALPRLRARGELAEVRATDLRFTHDETAAFLNQVMSLGLSAKDTATLERRTEGWIAGLKLAAISMKGRGDVRGFVDAFSGDNR
jgi:LuxR family maltose regulon positive regulatory protein